MNSSAEHTIKTERLAVGYSKFPIVSDISLGMQPGELLVLIGTNGSGKSTILKTMAGLLQPVHCLHAASQL